VIFGGRSEIGMELAQLLAPGATVVLAARSPDRLSEQVGMLEKAGAAEVDVREFDADELTSHAPLVASITADHGPIGTAVLAFGVLGDQARAEKDPAHAAAVLHTDFVAQARTCRPRDRRFFAPSDWRRSAAWPPASHMSCGIP